MEQANMILFPSKYATKVPGESRQLTYKYNEECTQLIDVEYTPANFETKKLGGGDFVVMYIKTASGMFVYHLESEPYRYRIEMTKEDPNFYHNFVCRAPFFYNNDADVIKNEPPTFPVLGGCDLGKSEGRIIWWNAILYECCRISIRDEVKNYPIEYMAAIDRVAKFILHNEKILDLEERKRLDERTLGRFENLRTISKNGSRHQPQMLVLKAMLHRETGSAFYKMVTGVKKVEELRKKRSEK
jgi:hypothetical protein